MKNFFKSVLFSVSVVLFFAFCADGDFFSNGYGRDYDNSLFAPELIQEKKLEPFFRTPTSSYYGDTERIQGFYEQNTTDWYNYFDKQLDTTTIKKMLYSSTLPQIDTLIFFLKNPNIQISEHLRKNAILTYDDKDKSLDFLFYLGFALRCEIFSNHANSNWNYEPLTFKNNDLLLKLIKGGSRQEANVKSVFIKERYLFQVIRLLYFNEDYKGCEAFFIKNKAIFSSNSNTYYRALGYVAAALYKRKEYATSNYYYSLIFENCQLMQETALWSFHPQEEADFKLSLLLAKNNKEKSTLLFMMGYINDEVRAIKEIASLNIDSPYLDVLLTRAINKEEERILNGSAIALVDEKLSVDLIQTIQKGLLYQQNKKVAIWHLALGYLFSLSNDLKNAEIQFAQAESKSSNTLLKNSITLYRAINKIKAQTVLNEKTEIELLPAIQLILKDEADIYLRKTTAKQWLSSRFSMIYKKQKEYLKAECWETHCVKFFYEDYNNLEKTIKFINTPAKNEYEKLLKKQYAYSEDRLLETQAIINVYDDNISEGIIKLERNPKAGNDILLGDPFLIHINDCHDCDHEAEQKEKFTILSFLKRMDNKKRESNRLTNAEEKARLLFEVANGYYNITNFGNARIFYETGIAFNYDVNFDYLDYQSDEERSRLNSRIYDCQLASNYYKKALVTSNNIEFKAMCTFMLAKCEQNEFYRIRPKNYKGDFKAGKYFAELKTNFKSTKYYQEIIHECGYFTTYLNKK
ncbi:hypothetical protein [Emticicia sp. SJ17W-69]|uniref:hypothetical protein n=1 Tax=Emticicia sp. SJ17W-69 TaxID=3421657 RepID=UPI003EBAD77C